MGISDFSRFKNAKRVAVTFPTLTHRDGETIRVVFNSMIESKEQKDKNGAIKVDPETGAVLMIHVANVVDISDGEVKELVVGNVLYKKLNENYPNQGYVGRAFELVKHAKKDKEKFKRYDIFELVAE